MIRPTIYLIDASAYIYRAYHAIPGLSTKEGLPTNAAYGFITILQRVLKERQPRHLAIAFDAKGPTFRHTLYPDYKANRPPMPEDLRVQIPFVREIVEAHRILRLEQNGLEADDLMAAAARRLTAHDFAVVIVSGDKDLHQLASEAVTVWDPMNDRTWDPAAVEAKYGVRVEQLLDYFALVGDSSDNVPGVAGVGPKTAQKLIAEHGSLEGLYEHLDAVGAVKLREKIIANRDNAFLSRDLIRLNDAVEVPASPEAYLLPEPDEAHLHRLYTRLEFSSLIKHEVKAPLLDTARFALVADEPALAKLAETLRTAQQIVLDCETDSLDTVKAGLVGLALAVDDSAAWYVPVGHRLEGGAPAPGQLPLSRLREVIGPLLADPAIPKLGHNLKYDLGVLDNAGMQVAGILRDTMIASYLLDPSRHSHKLDDLSKEVVNVRLTAFTEVTGGDKREDCFVYVAPGAAKDYACEDVTATAMLWERFRPLLAEQSLDALFADIEMELVPILSAMERHGILVDDEVLARLSHEFSTEIVTIEEKIYQLAGFRFNVGSPKQLGEVLFEKLNLPRDKKTKTGYSTDVQVLEKLARLHPLPAAVMQHRTLAKLLSTYVEKLREQIHPLTGRVHTSFNQTVTATGRLSSSNPNLQNIPIRTPEGQKIRSAFIAAPGTKFVAADYSQIDLRVLAHYSKDPALLEAFRGGEDIHARTAAEIFRVDPAFVTSAMRRVAKSINFGIVYGMSAFGLANQLDLSRKEAATFIERYFALYAGVKRFMEEIVEQARRDGFVTTLFHRRRPLPDLSSASKTRRDFAERTAINTPIQGTAADIIKLATIAVDKALRREGLSGKILLQIHDELVLEAPDAEVERTMALLKTTMENAARLDVPLSVNVMVGGDLAAV